MESFDSLSLTDSGVEVEDSNSEEPQSTVPAGRTKSKNKISKRERKNRHRCDSEPPLGGDNEMIFGLDL